MTTKMIEEERSKKSLEASRKIAEKAEILALEKGWDYERAASYIMKLNPKITELWVRGYLKEDDHAPNLYSAKEADRILNEKVETRMRDLREPFDVAYKKVFSDEQNAELVKAYALG